jgi:hypothetical protein
MRAIKRGTTSNLIRFLLKRSDTGQPYTGLTYQSSGLRISTITDNEATPTAYTSAGSTIETVTTLGTYAAPTATKCRFREVDSTNHPGLYEIQLADARFAVASSKRLVITVSGVANLNQSDYEIQLDPVVVPSDAVTMPEIDGVPFEVWGASVLAVLCGVTVPANNIIPFKRRDGSTTIVTVHFGPTNGERSETTIVGE